jgi:hypothetical protein
MSDHPRFWFPAKRYGWGWGIPITWQGWTVFVLFFVFVLLGAFWFLPSRGPISFLIYTAVLCGVLMLICWAKGEPPRWRWGDKDSR